MEESRRFFLFLILLLGLLQLSSSFRLEGSSSSSLNSQNSLRDAKVREARQALSEATLTLQNNLVTSLANLANSSSTAGTNVSRAAHVLMRGLVTNSVSLVGVVGYLPRLLFLDGPSQFVEILKLLRDQQTLLEMEMAHSIDTLISYAERTRASGIGENFSPAITFFPNLTAGFGQFFTVLIDSLFAITAE